MTGTEQCERCGGEGEVLGPGPDVHQCPECDGEGSRECPKCEREVSKLVDTEESDPFDPDEVCGFCIRNHAENMAREGERLQGQRTAAEERAIERGERCGSGWPR